MVKRFWLSLGLGILLVGCQMAGPAFSTPAASPTVASTRTAIELIATPSATAEPTPAPTPTEPLLSVCSPFAGWSIEQLQAAVSNRFAPPPLGSDDPHQGVDLSDLDPLNGYARAGLGVQAVLDGVVVGRADERFPYGNALITEIPLDDLPSEWVRAFSVPETWPEVQGRTALTCPSTTSAEPPDGPLSLYLLYAHLQAPVSLEMGDRVTCGQAISAVGSSGNALNPHLHLELRVGPAGRVFGSLAHYDVSASPEEMQQYCDWRTGGQFVPLDPLKLLAFLNR
jgi:murein DD-endopeptidase MepM/ murein hydrolase activator NlpD